MRRVSAIVIACDEERSLPRALASLVWADEIVVVDSGSTDGTVAAAEAAVALAIALSFYHAHATVDMDRGNELKG